MCFCCCVTRKSILIYAIVISSFAFIYGIVAISKFGSSTEIYKALINKLKELEKENQYSSYSTSSTTSTTKFNYDYDDYDDYYNNNYNNYNNGYNNNNNYNYNNNYNGYYKTKAKRRNSNKNDDDLYYSGVLTGNPYNNEVAKAILDSASYSQIQSLDSNDIRKGGYGLIKSLKGIENGLGVILFIFPLIFLITEIIFMITICGIKEYQVLSDTAFKVFNAIRILCITLSTIFIFLSILYSVLLVVVLVQYIKLVTIIDSCVIGIIIGMVYGYYGLWYYIILSCAFCNERTLFLKVGCESNPGPDAQYRLNGEQINRNQGTQILPIIFNNSTPQIQNQSSSIQVYNNQAKKDIKLSYSNGIGGEYITLNGILYKRVDEQNNTIINNNVVNNNNNKEMARNNMRRNSHKKGSIKNQRRHSKSKISIQNDDDKKSQNSKAEILK